MDESLATLKRRAQTALAVGKGRLLVSSGRLLDDELTVKKAKLETMTPLTLHLRKVQIQATQASHGYSAAFAAILTDGSVVTWGREGLGGDSGAV